ncbi:hypothetical protein BH24ACT8_BH24ACT8_10630 [soil metagenome]
MTTTERTAASTPEASRRRMHPSVIVAATLTALAAAFGGYGSIYFSGLDGYTESDLTFLVAYLFMAVLGIVAAIAWLSRHPLGRPGVVLFAVWLTVFNVFKVGYVRETEAVIFLVVGLLILGLALAAPARAHVLGRGSGRPA